MSTNNMSEYKPSNIDYVSSDLNPNHNNNNNKDDNEYNIGRYEVIVPLLYANNSSIESSDDEDEVRYKTATKRRKKIRSRRYLNVTLKDFTDVDDVGMQLWRGSLLLADYVIHNFEQYQNGVVFELGSGVGFLTKLFSLLPLKYIYYSDYKNEIIDLGLKNIQSNDHVCPLIPQTESPNIYFRQLDWLNCTWKRDSLHANSSDKYTFNQNDTELFRQKDVYWFGADLIYDDCLTEALFVMLSKLMNINEHFILSMEKRFNFSIDSLSVVAHGYRRLLKYINYPFEDYSHYTSYNSDIQSNCNTSSNEQATSYTFLDKDKVPVRFVGKRIYLNFPQYVCNYDRTKDLEMWDITLEFLS